MPGGLPGGMLKFRIDRHITSHFNLLYVSIYSYVPTLWFLLRLPHHFLCNFFFVLLFRLFFGHACGGKINKQTRYYNAILRLNPNSGELYVSNYLIVLASATTVTVRFIHRLC